jgi:esterase/lipase
MSVEPVCFGKRELFGLYRPPQTSVTGRRHLLVICNSAFHEYFKTQFVARQLSKELTNIGYDVLRFDYSGQGNSGGDLQSLNWPADIEAAIDEGVAISGAMNTSLIGFRVGALLATNIGIRLHSLAMWDPVVSGKNYVNELRHVQNRLVRAHNYLDEQGRSEIDANELVGYRVGQGMLDDFEKLQTDWEKVNVERICTISSSVDRESDHDDVSAPAVVSEPFHCQWGLPSSRLLFAHGVVKRFVEFFE